MSSDALRVLRLTPYYFLEGRELTHRELQWEPIGGMQVQIMQTTEELSAMGVRQSVVFPRRPGMPRRVSSDERTRFVLLRLPIAPIPTRSKGYLGLLFSWGLSVARWCAGQRLRGHAGRHDVIHVHCSELPWTFGFAVLAKKLLGRPLVLTTHCSAIATFHPETPLGWVLIGPARVLERLAVRNADAAVVLTERVRRAYLDHGLTTEDRVHVLPDGVRIGDFEPNGGTPSDTVVLYCGRFAPEKGWADFVDAAAAVVASGVLARFVMCGDGNELPRCRKKVAALGLGEHLELPGHLNREDIAGIVREAAVVVVPSRHEELGGTVLEAMTAGRAVVVTDVGGLPDVVDHGRAGVIVPPSDPPALAAAITRLLGDAELRAALGAAGRGRAAAYEMRQVTGQLLDVYASAVGRAAIGVPT